jgi:hypothetical protein
MSEKLKRTKVEEVAGDTRNPKQPLMQIMRDLSLAELQGYLFAANETMHAAVTGGYNTKEWVQERFATSDVVFGVYSDPEERYGVGVAILRGIDHIQRMAPGPQRISLRSFYFKCEDKQVAAAHYLALGDGKMELIEAGGRVDPAEFTMFILDKMDTERRIKHAKVAVADMDAAIENDVDPTIWYPKAFEADLVYGVWPDEQAPANIRVALLKCDEAYRRIHEGGRKEGITQVSIRCISMAHAETLCRLLGDGRQKDAY